MLVDFAIEAQRHRGLAPVGAIREACLLRFRPIMMTTLAALLGGVPLMLGAGTGAEIRQPLAMLCSSDHSGCFRGPFQPHRAESGTPEKGNDVSRRRPF